MCLAVPGRILEIAGDDPMLRTGRVDFAGIVKQVSLSFVPEAQVGQFVLVHVGFAIEVMDEAEANQVFEYLREMGDLAELEADPADGTSAGDSGPEGTRSPDPDLGPPPGRT